MAVYDEKVAEINGSDLLLFLIVANSIQNLYRCIVDFDQEKIYLLKKLML